MHVTVQNHMINEQDKGFANMMDLDNTRVSKECDMVCMDIHYEDWDENIIMYGDQGVSTKEHNEAMYAELTKMESKEEQDSKYNMALCANDSVSLKKWMVT